jgi:parallel beta-helix repeat protein
MIKGYVLIAAAMLMFSNPAAYAAGQPVEAKSGAVSKAASPLYPQVSCSGYPLIISQPGSFILNGNITLSCGVDAIDVKADNVVIDLGGYTITGTGSGSGIGINGPTHSNVTVRNGSVLKMGGGGIDLGASATIEEVTASSNGTSGILIANGIIREVHANFNGTTGISATSTNTELSDSEVTGNSNGVMMSGSTLLRNNIANNQFDGIVSVESVISNNRVHNNGRRGIVATGQISNNEIARNLVGIELATGFGVEAGIGTNVVGNTISSNSNVGIDGESDFSYGSNQLFRNNETSFPSPSTQVLGGVQMGPNICDGVLCP